MTSRSPISTIPRRFGDVPLDKGPTILAKLIQVENSIQINSDRQSEVSVLIREAGISARINLNKDEALHVAAIFKAVAEELF